MTTSRNEYRHKQETAKNQIEAIVVLAVIDSVSTNRKPAFVCLRMNWSTPHMTLFQQHESFTLLANAASGIVGGASGTAVGQPFDTVRRACVRYCECLLTQFP